MKPALQSMTYWCSKSRVSPIFNSYRQLSTTHILSASKERVVILGTGWGGFRLAKDLDKDQYHVTVVSPRNHFIFTPLLPSTSVGTLEFRSVQEPIRTIPSVNYHQAKAKTIDFENQNVTCTDVYAYYDQETGESDKERNFVVPYDKLVVAVGTKSNTFNVPGLVSQEEERKGKSGTNRKNVFFLKQLEHSRTIRNR